VGKIVDCARTMFSWSDDSALGRGRNKMPRKGISSNSGIPRLVLAALSAT